MLQEIGTQSWNKKFSFIPLRDECALEMLSLWKWWWRLFCGSFFFFTTDYHIVLNLLHINISCAADHAVLFPTGLNRNGRNLAVPSASVLLLPFPRKYLKCATISSTIITIKILTQASLNHRWILFRGITFFIGRNKFFLLKDFAHFFFPSWVVLNCATREK